jgi:hypothetical protein
MHVSFFKLFNSGSSRMANRRFLFRRLHAYPVTFKAAPFAVPMIDVTLQFTHGDSAGFARHFTPLAFPARIDTFNNLSISLCCALFRITRLRWRAACDSAPKKILTQGLWRQELEKHILLFYR